MATTKKSLIPLTEAVSVLRTHGASISYRLLWDRVANGIIPATRIKRRVFLIGTPAELASIIKRDALGIKAVK